MKPYLRPTDDTPSAPDGWVAEPAGVWADQEVEVHYDPVRHDVTFFRADIGDDVRDKFREIGFEQLGVDGSNEMWVRDRRSALQAAWERVERTGSRERTAELGGLSL